jgi:DNA-binding transcriptional MerR regulator
MKLELETFMPSEAESITKVTQATVRNWRRAGYLERRQGHARYNIADLLVMTVMQELGARGVTPEYATKYASEAARAIFQSLIFSRLAYSRNAYYEAYEAVSGKGDNELQGALARLALAETAAAAFLVPGLKHPNWLIIWANGKSDFYYDDDENFQDKFFGSTRYSDEFIQGPVTLFCLGAMAHKVLNRLPRPAIKLEGER